MTSTPSTELQGEEGPCLDAFSTGQPVQASAADGRTRWPAFVQHASDSGFQMMERALRERSLLTEQLQAALNSRVIIEQAKGMLAEYLKITMVDAFALLRTYARDHNRKLSDAARDVVDRKIPSTTLDTRPGRHS